jgi:hypothetical protein
MKPRRGSAGSTFHGAARLRHRSGRLPLIARRIWRAPSVITSADSGAIA